MARPGTVIGWTLDEQERDALLATYSPKFETLVAHHVTLATEAQGRPLPAAVRAAIVGRTDDDAGVEAMVVAIDGTTTRPDGSTFHITWSLGDGRRARESNDVIKARGWEEFAHPVPITLTPARI